MPDLSGDDSLLSSLYQHPGLQVLLRRIEAKKDHEFATLARRLASAKIPADQRAIDEMRGFWKGVEHFQQEIKRGHKAFADEPKEVSPRG